MAGLTDHGCICLRIEVGTSIPGERIVRVLDQLMPITGKPAALRVDNGPEFTSKALDSWAMANGVTLDFTRPGKPTDKAHVESFNGKFMDECLNANHFRSVADAKHIIEAWRLDYNQVRPHSALHGLTPEQFHRQVTQQRPLAAGAAARPVAESSSNPSVDRNSTFCAVH